MAITNPITARNNKEGTKIAHDLNTNRFFIFWSHKDQFSFAVALLPTLIWTQIPLKPLVTWVYLAFKCTALARLSMYKTPICNVYINLSASHKNAHKRGLCKLARQCTKSLLSADKFSVLSKNRNNGGLKTRPVKQDDENTKTYMISEGAGNILG